MYIFSAIYAAKLHTVAQLHNIRSCMSFLNFGVFFREIVMTCPTQLLNDDN